jgi:hypothetical protein
MWTWKGIESHWSVDLSIREHKTWPKGWFCLKCNGDGGFVVIIITKVQWVESGNVIWPTRYFLWMNELWLTTNVLIYLVIDFRIDPKDTDL